MLRDDSAGTVMLLASGPVHVTGPVVQHVSVTVCGVDPLFVIVKSSLYPLVLAVRCAVVEPSGVTLNALPETRVPAPCPETPVTWATVRKLRPSTTRAATDGRRASTLNSERGFAFL